MCGGELHWKPVLAVAQGTAGTQDPGRLEKDWCLKTRAEPGEPGSLQLIVRPFGLYDLLEPTDERVPLNSTLRWIPSGVVTTKSALPVAFSKRPVPPVKV